jgi:hypothetical protein
MNIVPSIELIPAKYGVGTLLTQVPMDVSGDFSVTRATAVATRYNSAGLIETIPSGIPRLDYYTSSGTPGCPALLVEPSGTNIIQRSEEFDNSYWTKANGNATGTTETAAPNGAFTAENYVVNNGAAGNSPIVRIITLLANTTYTLSLFIKRRDYDTASIRIYTDETSFAICSFNLSTGTASGGSILNFGNGWYRVSVTLTTAATVTNSQVQLIRDAQIRDGVAGIYIWGAQLETSSVATSYIPTTTGSVTRDADVITKTGVSSLIGQTEGTIYAEVDLRASASSSARRIVNIRVDGNNLLSLEISTAGTSVDFSAVSGGSSVTATASGITTGIYKIAVGYNSAASGTVLYVNGTLRDTKTIAIPNLSAAVFGLGVRGDGAAGTQFNDRIRAAAIYNKRLPNDQLQALTTL